MPVFRRCHLGAILVEEGAPVCCSLCLMRELDRFGRGGKVGEPDVVPVLRCEFGFGNAARRAPYGADAQSFLAAALAAQPDDAYGHEASSVTLLPESNHGAIAPSSNLTAIQSKAGEERSNCGFQTTSHR